MSSTNHKSQNLNRNSVLYCCSVIVVDVVVVVVIVVVVETRV